MLEISSPVSEMQLIAPEELSDLAGSLLGMFEAHEWGQPMKPITEKGGQLFKAMRADLNRS
jgi:hypothetical protein